MRGVKPIHERSFDFSVRIVNLYKTLKKQPEIPYPMINQLLRAGTSIGANIAEAQAAQSTKDFIGKMSIASKEARETYYWLKLLVATNAISEKKASLILDETNQIVAILTSIVHTSQKKQTS